MASEALFLHFDEELTAHRRLPVRYTAEDLVFWLHFYSLFFERLYIPANHFVDVTPCSFDALRLAGIEKPDSILRMPDGPIKVLWDDSRFPFADFAELARGTSADPFWCTVRAPEQAAASAELCDKARLQVVRANMASRCDPEESIAQLRTEVFTTRRNSALRPAQHQRLQQCLSSIKQRGLQGDIYSRNFYTAIFGYGRTPEMQRLAARFTDIVSSYRSLENHFLTGVDYVSHSLKAAFASEALSKQEQRLVTIDVLMPDEYARFVRPPEKSGYPYHELDLSCSTESLSRQPNPIIHSIDRGAILALDANRLQMLRRSEEYNRFQTAIEALRNPIVGAVSERERVGAEQALNAYLRRVTVTLRPIVGRCQLALSLIGRVKFQLAASAVVVLMVQFPDPTFAAVAKKAIEIFARLFAGSAVTRAGTKRVGGRETSLPATFRLGKEIKVYL